MKVPFSGLPRTASAGGEAGESASAEQEWADCRRRHFFMAYATLDQLVSLFGGGRSRTLSDRQGTGELDEAVISDAWSEHPRKWTAISRIAMRRRFRTLILFRPWWFRLPGTSPGIGSPGRHPRHRSHP